MATQSKHDYIVRFYVAFAVVLIAYCAAGWAILATVFSVAPWQVQIGGSLAYLTASYWALSIVSEMAERYATWALARFNH